jgi:copper chaperone CopZ
MSTQTFAVTGMTCEHCVAAVRSELGALVGVTEVGVDLDAGATSVVTVTAAEALSDEQVAAALDEAGAYELARGV